MEHIAAYFAILTGVGLAAFAVVAYSLSRRQKRDYENMARVVTFHCMKCDSVYTAPNGTETESCPNCGYKNSRLRF